MSYIDPTPVELEREKRNAQLNPVVFDDSPAWYSGLASAVPEGIGAGVLKTGEGLLGFLEPGTDALSSAFNAIGIKDNGPEWSHYLRNRLANYTARIAPDPYTTGAAGQLVYSLFSQAVPMVAGAYFGGPVGAASLSGLAEGVNTYDSDTLSGIDAGTAQGHALISGATVAAMSIVPFHAGKLKVAEPFLNNVATQAEKWGWSRPAANIIRSVLPHANTVIDNAIGNAALGIASRGFSSDLLRAHGYDWMANQYEAYDKWAMASDVIMSLGFGHFSKLGMAIRDGIRQRDIDAALTAAQHVFSETDAAPGMPVNVMSRDAHTQALNKAWNDVMSGDPVDVEGLVAHAEFLPKTGADRLAAGIREAMSDEDHTDTFIRRYITPTFRGEDIEALEKQYFADLDTERTINGENIRTDDSVAQQYANENPDLVLHHTDEGKAVTVAEAMDEADTGIAQAKQDGHLIDVAVKCFLSGGEV
ncbi:hypothetical protein JE599_001894 [Salmonella enterica]|nr:hypothetical protein [Salmonella enterica]